MNGIALVFHLELPDETSVGARVAARQLARVLANRLITVAVDERGRIVPVPEGEDAPLAPADVPRAFANFAEFVTQAAVRAEAEAQRQLGDMQKEARALLAHERAEVKARLELLVARNAIAPAALDESRADYQARITALGQLRLTLDSACAFVIA